MPFNPANDLIDDAALGSSPSDNASGLPIPSAGGKKKKKSKKNNVSKPPKWEDTEDNPYATSVTPSPPVHNGVPLREPTPPQSEPEPMTAGEEDDLMAWDGDAAPPPELELEMEPEMETPHEPNHTPAEVADDFGEEPPAFEAPKQPVPSAARRALPRGPASLQSTHSPPAKPAAPAVVPPSPPLRKALPVRSSEHDPSRRRLSVSERSRRGSFTQQRQYTPPKSRNAFVEPSNPPHMMQSHFFTTPSFNFGASAAKQEKGGKTAGSDHYYCSFDTFAESGDASAALRARDALLVGCEGGLEVYRVLYDKIETVGRLEGLRGGVTCAKILPGIVGAERSQDLVPLVAVIVHGPMAVGSATDSEACDSNATVTHYQTTVEIYSLRDHQHVSTLYRSLPVALPEPTLGLLGIIPPPVGDLRLDAKGRFLTISSGKSGEIFVFACSKSHPSDWEYVGKYWTSLQSRFDIQPRPSTSSEGTLEKQVSDPLTSPLMSLNSRWLAIVPPSSSSKVSVHASIAGQSQPPGASDHVAPTQPNPTLDVIGLNAEGVLAKYSRQAAQEFLKASRRGIEMGMAGWKEFTQPSSPTKDNSQQHARADSGDGGFPPTNAPGEDKRRAIKQPAVVSIIDLERLSDANRELPSHMATFALEDGCNYLSFSEDGLHLLTTNRTGEASHIWNLRHASHAPSHISSMDDGEAITNAHIKRVHRIVRNTQAVMLDAIWARDGNFVALLTGHGTVHLHEASPSTREPQKRRRRSTSVASAQLEKADATVGVSQGLSPPSSNGFLTSIRSGWQSVSTQVNTIRSNTANGGLGIPTTFAGFREAANAGAGMSGRAVARGLSQGYSVAKIGVGDMWHADDNKIRHKEFADSAAAGSIRWLRKRSGMSIAITCGGKVFLHPVQRVTRQRGESTFTGLKAEKSGKREFPLPTIATASAAPNSSCADQGPHGFWGLRDVTVKRSAKAVPRVSEDDKTRYETNPPYCPLYIDRRVSMLGYDDTGSGADSTAEFIMRGNGFDEDEPWTFGEPLPAATKLNQQSAPSPASSFDASQHDDDGQDYEHHTDFDGATDPEGQAAGVESRIIVNPATSEIRINSSRSKRKTKQLGRPVRREEADGDFELLEDDDEDALF